MTRDVTICLLTAHRLDYAMITLTSILGYADPLDRVHVHIASDGDDRDYLSTLVNVCHEMNVPVSISNAEGQGYGANWNRATQVIHQIEGMQYVLPIEDDWECMRKLDLDLLTRMMEEGRAGRVGCIRLGYLGFTDYLHATLTHLDGVVCGYLQGNSPEKHIFAGHPRFETVWWEREMGAWPEQEMISDPASGLHEAIKPTGRRLNPGETELAVCSKIRSGIVWPFGLIPPELFAHIGTVQSY